MKLILTIGFLILLSSCASISFVPANEENSRPKTSQTETTILDEEGNIIVRSGLHRDNRKGYYFDKKEGRCKEVFYSTGPGCIPPPFNTLEECESCR